MDDALERLRRLGFSEADATMLADHFEDAERRGKTSHGLSRIDRLAALPDLDPTARPKLADEYHGALMIVIAPETSTVPELRARAGSLRLPGDR